MLYISGARSVADEQVRIASTKIDGIGPKKAIQVRYRLGISGNIKINELTKGERADIERLISISCYRGIRHQDGSPVRGLLRHDISGLALRPPIVSAGLHPRSYCFRLSRLRYRGIWISLCSGRPSSSFARSD
ncbi:hypothetical protein M9H77_00519 [Catharanthus roseus]|nr:hypothetical protein M9H77_00504 [Catharanthus roseus]KAI5639237.1 hypothetical protein M9H77_00562 [Catharanthus roseus]KAI5642396.1 hypothetical protein M9H77_00519 [Catharanthus roseus]